MTITTSMSPAQLTEYLNKLGNDISMLAIYAPWEISGMTKGASMEGPYTLVHAILFPDGSEWDSINGWRNV